MLQFCKFILGRQRVIYQENNDVVCFVCKVIIHMLVILGWAICFGHTLRLRGHLSIYIHIHSLVIAYSVLHVVVSFKIKVLRKTLKSL